MVKKIFFIICIIFILSSCSSELNPEWYPHGWAGKDTIFVSRPNGKFSIGQYSKSQALAVNTDDERHDILLSSVTDHKRIEDKVYVYSDEGYCVIDETANTADVLVIVEAQYTVSGTNDPAVTYLKSFDDFSDKAKEIFAEMEQYWSDKEYRRYGSNGKIYPDGTIEYSDGGLYQMVVIYVILQLLVATVLVIIRLRARKK